MLLAQIPPAVIAVIVALAVFLLIAVTMASWVFKPWLQAYAARIPISIPEIIGMRFRRTDVNLVIRCLVLAKMSGIRIPAADMEKAYLQGAHLEKITLAMIQAKKQRKRLTFQELVDLDREDRLAEKLRE